MSIGLSKVAEDVLRGEIKWRDEHHSDSPFIFPGRTGGMHSDCSAVDRFRVAAGLPKGFRPFHGLRHHFAVSLANCGKCSMDIISEMLTHKNADFAKKIYAQFLPETLSVASNVEMEQNAAPDDKSAEVIALERKLADLHTQLREQKEKYTATAGREGKLKKRQEHAEAHMAVLVELASEVPREIPPPHTLTKDQLQKRYKRLAEQHGLSDVPAAYLKLFREHMPEELINRGSAPRQS